MFFWMGMALAPMDIDDAGDLIFQTYYMMDWMKAVQTPSEDRCVTCGRPMMKVESVRDRRGASYEGRVCHGCKALFWLKEG